MPSARPFQEKKKDPNEKKEKGEKNTRASGAVRKKPRRGGSCCGGGALGLKQGLADANATKERGSRSQRGGGGRKKDPGAPNLSKEVSSRFPDAGPPVQRKLRGWGSKGVTPLRKNIGVRRVGGSHGTGEEGTSLGFRLKVRRPTPSKGKARGMLCTEKEARGGER